MPSWNLSAAYRQPQTLPLSQRLTQAQRQSLPPEMQVPQKEQAALWRLLLTDSPSRRKH